MQLIRLQKPSSAIPSCGFYYYLVLSILLMLSLVLFTIAAKRYKLRERERHVNIQAIAEEHYERYLDLVRRGLTIRVYGIVRRH